MDGTEETSVEAVAAFEVNDAGGFELGAGTGDGRGHMQYVLW